MSGNRFGDLYLSGLENVLSVGLKLMEMYAVTQENPSSYDSRMAPIILRISKKVSEAAAAIGDASDLLKAFEDAASRNGGRSERLKEEIEKYLTMFPVEA